MKPWDFLTIVFEKKPIPSIEDINKFYNQFVMNMYLSCHSQTVYLAEQLSTMKISNKMHFDMLYYGVPEGKRFIKYNASKAKKDQDIQYLMEYFSCSHQTAKDYIQLISDDEMKEIKHYFERRGIK